MVKRIIILFVLIFSGVGWRVLQIGGSVIVWLILIIVFNCRPLLKVKLKYYLRYALLVLALITLMLVKAAPIPWFVLVAMTTSLVGLSRYTEQNVLFKDLRYLLRFYVLHVLLSVVLLFLPLHQSTIFFDYSEYRHIFYLFWYTPFGGPGIYGGLRPTSFFWEPGVLQFFLSLSLFMEIKSGSKRFALYALIALFSLLSTTGIISLALVFIVTFKKFSQVFLNKKNAVVFGVALMLFTPLLINNVEDKLAGSNKGSGLTRIADAYIALQMLQENPIVGADIASINPKNNKALRQIRRSFWQGNKTDGLYEAFLTVDNSNGLLRFMLDWGLPIGLILFFLVYKKGPFEDQRDNLKLIMLLVTCLFAEAISRTSIFYMIIFYPILTDGNNRYSFV